MSRCASGEHIYGDCECRATTLRERDAARLALKSAADGQARNAMERDRAIAKRDEARNLVRRLMLTTIFHAAEPDVILEAEAKLREWGIE